MKRTMTLALAALIFTLTLAVSPFHAVAGTTSAPPPPPPPPPPTGGIRKAGGIPLEYVVLAVGTLSSVLLP